MLVFGWIMRDKDEMCSVLLSFVRQVCSIHVYLQVLNKLRYRQKLCTTSIQNPLLAKKLKASLKFQKYRKYQSLVFIPFRFVNYKQNSYKISRKREKNQYSEKRRKLKILRYTMRYVPRKILFIYKQKSSKMSKYISSISYIVL